MSQAKSKKWNAHIALGYCPECKDDLVSLRGGLFVKCRCGNSFIDQERFGGLYVRLGGCVEFIEQICPPHCKEPEHRKKDKKLSTDKYLQNK